MKREHKYLAALVVALIHTSTASAGPIADPEELEWTTQQDLAREQMRAKVQAAKAQENARKMQQITDALHSTQTDDKRAANDLQAHLEAMAAAVKETGLSTGRLTNLEVAEAFRQKEEALLTQKLNRRGAAHIPALHGPAVCGDAARSAANWQITEYLTMTEGSGNPLAPVPKDKQLTSDEHLHDWYATGVRHLFNYCARNFVLPH